VALSHKDGGYKSRKLVMAYVSQGLITLGAYMAGKMPVFAPVYATFVGGILGAAALYMTHNVANTAVAIKKLGEQPEEPK
jgi:hypothetical protein